MEEVRYEMRVREQAAKTAEYLATAWQLEAHDDKQVFRRANQLGWELAFFLPPDVYRHVRDAVANPSADANVCSAVVAVRQHLLGEQAGNLVANELPSHSPNANSGPATPLTPRAQQ